MIVIVLMFVLFFGIGFILNMLMKTTWFPIYGYIALVIGLVIWAWQRDAVPFGQSVSGYGVSDYVSALAGLVGAALSGSTIKSLRMKGYKMF